MHRAAGAAAATAAAEEIARTLATARETGRLVLDLPLEAIAADHLTRDRLPVEDEEMVALKSSLAAHGQRTPIEVTPLTGALPYGLISGWRRLSALKALLAETGDAATLAGQPLPAPSALAERDLAAFRGRSVAEIAAALEQAGHLGHGQAVGHRRFQPGADRLRRAGGCVQR